MSISPISDYRHPGTTTAFEHECCTRCGGGGMFGPACVYAGRCFKCGGSGWNYTARGARAQAMFADALRVPASDVKVGDKVRVDGVPGIAPSYWLRVEEITLGESTGRSRVGDGDWVEHVTPRVDMRGSRRRPGGTWDDELEASGYGVDATMRVRIERIPAFKQAAVAEALAFQATLTKRGLTAAEAAAKRAEAAEARAARAAAPAVDAEVADPFDGVEVRVAEEPAAPAIADDAALMARMLGQA